MRILRFRFKLRPTGFWFFTCLPLVHKLMKIVSSFIVLGEGQLAFRLPLQNS